MDNMDAVPERLSSISDYFYPVEAYGYRVSMVRGWVCTLRIAANIGPISAMSVFPGG